MSIKEKMLKLSCFKRYLFVALVVVILLLGFWLWNQPSKQIKTSGEQIVLLIDNIRNFYQNKPSAWGLNTFSAIQNKIVPMDMLNGRQIKNALGKDVLLGADMLGNTVMPGSKTFAVVYKNLNKEECEILAQWNFPEKILLSLDSIHIVNEKTYDFSWGNEQSLPISHIVAQNACQKNNDIWWNIYL